MREIRKSGSEGGVGFYPPFLPLSLKEIVLPMNYFAEDTPEPHTEATSCLRHKSRRSTH